METDIDNFRMLKNIQMKSYDNSQLGELVRVEHMVAEKLQSYLTTIDEAVKAIVDGKTRWYRTSSNS